MKAMKASSLSPVILFLHVMIVVEANVSVAASDDRAVETRNLTCHPVDLAGLQGFRKCIELPIGNWGDLADSECCSWTGITCGTTGGDLVQARVVRLDLSDRGLMGHFCDPLVDLDQLVFLNLSGNQLGGALPPKLLWMRNLEVLDLSRNQFTGYFPFITDMPAIRVLHLSDNRFFGRVPMTICDSSPDILSLNMARNAFSGEFPPNIGNCSVLQYLSLEENSLFGDLPKSLFELQNLHRFQLWDNSFSGILSTGICNLSNLIELDISGNSFFGELPDCFANTPNLERFSAGSNRFGGSLPYSLVNSRSIKILELNNNTFEGGINMNCSTMSHLAVLNLGSNLLQGEIPKNLSSCHGLHSLNLSNNNLTGTIPNSFQKLRELSELFISRTRVYDLHSALQTLQQCRNLNMLILSKSFRNEQLPSHGGFLFQNLSVFVISNSQLTGALPPWLSESGKLRLLDLSWNRLNGDIPQWVGDFKFMFYLSLANNSFSGNIPESLNQLPGFIDSNMSSLEPVSRIPLLLGNGHGRFLQYNQYWNLPSTLDLSYNRLIGPIWPSFGNLKRLHVLHLDNNNLSGEIPDSLGSMASLEKLTLSHNKLSGKIPSSLVQLTFLSHLDLSYNKLSGVVPSGGQFSTFPDSSFEGNDGLCGWHSRPCSPPEDHEPQAESWDENFELPVTEAIVGGGFGFLVTVGYCFASGWVTKTPRRRFRCFLFFTGISFETYLGTNHGHSQCGRPALRTFFICYSSITDRETRRGRRGIFPILFSEDVPGIFCYSIIQQLVLKDQGSHGIDNISTD